jgi:hypothetical protein
VATLNATAVITKGDPQRRRRPRLDIRDALDRARREIPDLTTRSRNAVRLGPASRLRDDLVASIRRP